MEQLEQIRGSEAIIRSLLCEGVDRVFGYPGGAIISVYDTLFDFSDQIEHVLVRHEQGAIHAAQGYSRACGKPGVVIVTSGPGATNVITGLADALMDSTPLIVITGQVATEFLGSDAFQETDVVSTVMPVTKWAVQIRTAAEVPGTIARAFYVATQGRPGPVVLDIAKDAQVGLVNWSYSACTSMRSYRPVADPAPALISEAAKLINSSERPLLLSGHGVTISGAESEIVALSEKADIPVATTLLGLSTISSDNPHYKGMVGLHGNIGPNYNTNRADLIIAVGLRFDDRVTSDLRAYAPQARIIHIDIDNSEFNKNIPAAIHLHADARKALTALIPLINQASRQEWNATFDRCEQIERERIIENELHPGSGPLKMGEVVNVVSEATGHNAICVTDVGLNQMFAARYFRFTQPRSMITSGGLGTMGFGIPAAIGAKMGCPERTVCLFVGDGGFQMTIEELGTIMQYGTAVKIIILNNNYLGNVRQWQKLFFKGRYSQTHMLNPDFTGIAHAYGIAAEDVDNRSQLAGAIDRMLNSDGPYILNVNIDPEGMVFPMVKPGQPVDRIMLNSSELFE